MMKKLAAVAMLMLGTGVSGAAFAQSTEITIANPAEDPVNTAPVADTLPIILTRSLQGPSGAQQYDVSLRMEEVVPAGFRLIVDHITVGLTLPPAHRGTAELRIGTPNNLPTARIQIPTSLQMTWYSPADVPIYEFFWGSTPAHVALEAGQQMTVQVIKGRASGFAGGSITLQGHLVRLQTSGQ